MAGIILPRVNDRGKAGDEFFHGRPSTLNPRLESSHASPSNPHLQPPAPYAIALSAPRLAVVIGRRPRYTTLLRAVELWGAVQADGPGRLAGDEEPPAVD